MLLGTTNSKAILQANATTHKSPATKNGATWITQIRQMETSGQTMGLTETLNGLNATSASNGIDVHMMLPTEYGAVAILSASGYGNSGKLRDETDAQKRTSTGNSTGVYFTGDRWEWVSAYNDKSYGIYSTTSGDNKKVLLTGSIDCFMGDKGWHGGKFSSKIDLGSNFYAWPVYNLNSTNSLVAGGVGLFSCGEDRHASTYWSGWGSNDSYNLYLTTRGSAV